MNYSTATKSVSLIVNKATPGFTCAVGSVAPLYYGTPTVLTCQVAGLPQATGMVQFFDGQTMLGTLPLATISSGLSEADYTSSTFLVGPHSFTGTYLGDGNYGGGTTAAIPFTIVQGPTTVSWTPVPAAEVYGTPVTSGQLDAIGMSLAGLAIQGTYQYNHALSDILPAGSNTLTVNFTPNDLTDFVPSTGQANIVVSKATPVVNYPTPAGIAAGTPLSATQQNATATGINGTPLAGTFSYFPALGTVLPVGTTTLTATFTPADTLDYNTASASAPLVVGKTTPTIAWAMPAGITQGTALSATQLNAVAMGVGGVALPGTYVYTPGAGTVLGVGTQTLSVLFTPNDTATYTTATQTTTLVVGKATPTLTWAMPAGITQGMALSTTQLNAVATGVGGVALPGTYVYTPGAGTVLGVGTQTLSVLFTPTDTTTYTTATKTTTLVVGKATPTITWAMPAGITQGTALSATQLDAVATGVGGVALPGTYVYTPGAGTVLNAGTQTLSVLFTPTDTIDYGTVTQTTTLVVGKATPTVTWATPAAISQGTPLSATQLNAVATGVGGVALPGTFMYTPAAGTVLGLGTQTLSVLFTPTDAVNYTTATQTTKLVVNSPTTTTGIASSANPSQFGQPVTLTATLVSIGTLTVQPTGTVIFRDGTQTLGMMNVTGNVVTLTVSTLTTGSHAITALYSGDTNYGASSSTLLTQVVGQGVTQVAWTPATAAIVYGTGLTGAQLDATAATPYSTSVAGTFVYTPATGAVLGAGTQTLRVAFTPSDAANYQAAAGTASITVQKAVPVLTWPTPAGVVAGTLLSATQLDATAAGVTGVALPGTFTYTPAAGTPAQGGTQTLSVLFTPTDSADYTTATATVQLAGTNLALTALSSNTALLGDPDKTITLTGAGFLPTSVVRVNNLPVLTTYVSATTLTAVISSGSFQTVQTIQVLVADPNESQTSNTLTIKVSAPVVPIVFSAPGTATPAAQPAATLQLANPYPVVLTGTVTLTFTPLAGQQDDPNIQFASGGRTKTFQIPANSTATPSIQFQAGTVAGAIGLTLDLTAGGVDVTPATVQPVAIQLPAAVPGITSATFTQTGETVTVTVVGYSNTVQMGNASFHFTAADGGSLKTPDVAVNVGTLFGTYYSSGAAAIYGSEFTYVQTFTLSDSTKIGQVMVTLTNSVGDSVPATTF